MAVFETLRTGSRGPLVEMAQLGLQRAGFYQGNIDGVFGRITAEAARRFQQSNNLTPDGVIGPRTWETLTPWLTGFRYHIIRQGDTLYRISQRYDSSITAIETANPNIDPMNLRVGSRLAIPLDFNVVPTNISFTSFLLELTLQGLKARYPFINISVAGRSVMGKPLYYVQIGSGNNQVFYNGSHHANEWITTTVLMKFIEDYAKAYANDSEIFNTSAEELFNTASLYIIPMVNPDGVDLVTGLLNSGSFYNDALSISADYPGIPFPNGWKANINGIDTNLQYPAGWETAREIKFAQGFVSPAPRDFVGNAPLEAPESRAVYEFTRLRNFSITLSYHTQGEVIFWKYLDYLPENSFEIAQQFGDVSGYLVEETPSESGYAGYKDWFIMTYNRPSYTIEAGKGVSPLPLSQFNEIYNDNIGILVLGLTVTA
ncbi:MAG: LysM peptidoglycan-binding domain-containing protein [Ruminococcaceae bacterium]|nr:LysM peptidoglycan-binding domain-containing protein [Oscillospiraceae bacterium]